MTTIDTRISNPIETYRRLKNDLEQMLERCDDFSKIIDEISGNPFIAKPSPIILESLQEVNYARARVVDAIAKLKTIAPMIDGAEPTVARTAVGHVVDACVREKESERAI